MKTIIILRHAKSDWGDSNLRDFDRGLNGRGFRAAAVMGRWAATQQLEFDAIVASPAVRVKETLAQFREAYGDSPTPSFDLRLYLAPATTLAEVAAEASDDDASLLLVAHSPGLEDFILASAPEGRRSELRDSVAVKFPTAALAILDFDVDSWRDLADGIKGKATLRSFVRPRDLDPALGPDM